jgi:hypothetical protein
LEHPREKRIKDSKSAQKTDLEEIFKGLFLKILKRGFPVFLPKIHKENFSKNT